MNVVRFEGLLSDDQLKQVEQVLSNNGVLSVNKIPKKVFEYPVFKTIEEGHYALSKLGNFRLNVIIQKLEFASRDWSTGVDFNTALNLTSYLNVIKN